MTLNAVTALILLYFTEVNSFACLYGILSAEYRLPLLDETDQPYSALCVR